MATAKRRRRSLPDATRVIGYIRVSTESQAESGAGLEAQEAAIRSECARRGLTLVALHADRGWSAKTLDRPALTETLRALDSGEAGALMVAKVDRLSRSVADFGEVLKMADHGRWKLIALDLGVDTTTPAGEMMANVVAVISQYERKLIGARTKEALAARKAAGMKLGRPRLLSPELADRIRRERADAATLQAIADGLNSEGILTPTGRQWNPALVRKVALQEVAA